MMDEDTKISRLMGSVFDDADWTKAIDATRLTLPGHAWAGRASVRRLAYSSLLS